MGAGVTETIRSGITRITYFQVGGWVGGLARGEAVRVASGGGSESAAGAGIPSAPAAASGRRRRRAADHCCRLPDLLGFELDPHPL